MPVLQYRVIVQDGDGIVVIDQTLPIDTDDWAQERALEQQFTTVPVDEREFHARVAARAVGLEGCDYDCDVCHSE